MNSFSISFHSVLLCAVTSVQVRSKWYLCAVTSVQVCSTCIYVQSLQYRSVQDGICVQSLQYRSVQDGIYVQSPQCRSVQGSICVLGNDPIHSTPSVRNLPSVAHETVLVFCLMMALSPVHGSHQGLLPFS